MEMYRLPKFIMVLTLGFAVAILFGCAAIPKYIIEGYKPPESLAVLPFANFTTDLDGPVIVRFLFHKHLPKRGYKVIPIEAVDELLQKQGITDAGQLSAISPQELGEKLKVDALIYGDLLEFKYVTLGIYNTRTVHANFKMVDARTSKTLWEDEKKVSNKRWGLSIEAAKEAFAKEIVGKLIDKIFRSPLKEEADEVVTKAASTLPVVRK